MKKLIIKTLVLFLALSVCSIKPVFADENLDNEPVISEVENTEEIVESIEEDENEQETIEDIIQEDSEIAQEEIIDPQEETDIPQEEVEEIEEVSIEKETPDYSLNTVSGPLTSGSVLHSGSCGDNLTYTHYSDYSLVISGTGDMVNDDYPWENWARNWSSVYSIIIEEGVTSIGDRAFEHIFNVHEPIVLPSTLTEIGDYAFAGDYLLSKIYIPSTVSTIGVDAFRGCSSSLVLYTDVEDSSSVPAGWDSSWDDNVYYIEKDSGSIFLPYYDLSDDPDYDKYVEPYIVEYNTSIDTFNSLTSSWDYNSTTKTLTISGNGPMTTYLWDGQPWRSKGTINKIVIEEGVTIISPAAFMMNGASSVTIPSSVYYIAEEAFSMCNLTSVTIPATVTKIGKTAFGSSNTISMSVESGNPNYDSRDNCNAIIETATNTLISGCKNTVIPSTVTTIATNAFQNIESMTYFAFPSTVEHIYPNFNGCFYIDKIFVSKDTDTIDKFAFNYHAANGLVIYTDAEDSSGIPDGWDENWNGYRDDNYDIQHYTVVYNTSYEDFIDIASRQPAPTDITIKEDTSGNIVIHSNNTTYLETLAALQPEEPRNSGVNVFYSDSEAFYFNNFISNSYEIVDLYYDAAKKTVTLKNADITDHDIPNGSRRILLNVEGYESFEKTITLTKACKPAPTDVTISENANGDIVITSSNTAWIKSITQEGGSVLLCDDEEFGYEGFRTYLYGNYNTPAGSFAITNSGRTLTITNEHIVNMDIPSDTYYIQLKGKGYLTFEYSNPFNVTKGAKLVDLSTISVECDQANQIIKIKSNSEDNDEYMEKLASYSIRNWTSNKEITESEGGQIRVTDNDSIYAWFENYQHKTDGELDCDIKDMELSDDKKTLTLTKDAIYGNHVVKGNDYEITIMVPGYIDVYKDITNSTVGVEACPAVNIEEDAQGNIVISSNDLNYLQALVEESSDDRPDRGYVYIFTELHNTPTPMNWLDVFYNQSYHSDLILDESAKTVTIENSEILVNNVTNGSHDIELYAYGYTVYESNITLEHACDLAPTGVTATVNTNGDLVITSTNTDWINQLATYGGVSFISTVNDDEYFVDANPEHPFTISNSGKTVTIAKYQITNSNIANGTYTLQLLASGYSRVNINKTITLTKACKPISASAVNVTYDTTNEAIIISSTNKDWLANLCKVNKYYSYSNSSAFSYDGGGNIHFYNDTNDLYSDFENSIEYVDGRQVYSNNEYSLSADKLSVIIPKESIYNQTLVEGYEYSVILHAFGYQSITINKTETLEIGVSEQLPTSVTISFESINGNMYISANDSDWLEGIMYGLSDAGRIEIVDENDELIGIFSNNYYDEPIITRVDNNKIKLSEDAIWLNYVPTGQYYVHIYSYGYSTFKANQTQEIKGLRQSPSPISARLVDDKVILEYGDNNKTYLQDLAAIDPAPLVGGIKSYVAFMQDGNDEDGLFYTNQDGDNSIFYDETRGYAYVELGDGKEYLKKHFNNVDDLKIELFAFGYKDYIIDDFEFKFIDEPGPIVLGGKKQLTFSDYDEDDVYWDLSDYNVADIDQNGVLTASGIGTTTVTATYEDGVTGEVISTDSITVTVTSNSRVALKLKTTDGNAVGMVGTPEQLELTATGYTITDLDPITYTSSDETVAKVENGTVSFLKPGIVTITANAVGGRTTTLKLTVYKVDPTKKVSLTYSGGTLEAGDVVSNKLEMLAGGDALPNGTELTYASSNIKVATVDESGKITAVGKGTATITVALKDDPAKRKATCKVTVIDRVIYSFDKDVLDVENATGSTLIFDHANPSTDADSRVVLFDFADVDKQTKLHIITAGSGIDKNSDPYTPAGVKYTSTDTSIVTVDNNGYVTFKKAGLATVTVTVTTNPKGMATVSRDIIFKAINYAPRIEVNKFTLNKYFDSSNYPSYKYYEVLTNTVSGCEIAEVNGLPSNYFDIDFDNGDNKFTIKFKQGVEPKDVPAKSFSQIIKFKTGADPNYKYYSYKVTVAVAQTLPSVTPKVTGFYNTFTNENTLELVNTVKNGTISNIEFVDDWATYDSGTGKITAFTTDAKGKLVVSGKVRFRFTGYTNDGYVEKTIRLTTKTTKPTVKLDNTTFTLYVPDGTTGNKTISFKLIDNTKNAITEGKVIQTLALNESTLTGGSNEYTLSGDGTITATIPVEGLKAGKIMLSYKVDGWPESSAIPLTINVKVATALPKAKLSATTLTLDKNFANSGNVDITIPGSSETITWTDFTVTPNLDDEMLFDVKPDEQYSPKKLLVNSTVPGTYKVICNPYMGGMETKLSPLSLTVKVVETKPTVKLKTTSVKYNRLYSESILIDFSLTNNKYNAYVTGFDIANYTAGSGGFTGDLPISVSLDNNKLKLSYDKDTGSSYLNGKYKIVLTPKFKNENIGQYDNPIEGTPIIISVELYNKTPAATVSIKNAINPLDASSSSPITVKLTNLVDTVESIEIIDPAYSDWFDEINDTLVLKAKANKDFSGIKDGTYKINAKVHTALTSTDGGIPTTLSIKIARKAPTVKLTTPTINLYDNTANGLVGETDITFPDGYTIDETQTVFPATSAYKVEYDQANKKIKVTLLDGSKVKGASTTSFSIKLIWKGDYTNNGKFTKTSTVKLSVKDMSYSIKAN